MPRAARSSASSSDVSAMAGESGLCSPLSWDWRASTGRGESSGCGAIAGWDFVQDSWSGSDRGMFRDDGLTEFYYECAVSQPSLRGSPRVERRRWRCRSVMREAGDRSRSGRRRKFRALPMSPSSPIHILAKTRKIAPGRQNHRASISGLIDVVQLCLNGFPAFLAISYFPTWFRSRLQR
jgi:hypothetical protein